MVNFLNLAFIAKYLIGHQTIDEAVCNELLPAILKRRTLPDGIAQ
jgi:hypothetical protein